MLLFLFWLWVATPSVAQQFECAGHLPPRLPEGASAKSVVGTPTSKTVHVLVIYTKFHGEDPDNQTAPPFAHQIFDEDIAGSFSHFYREMSGGQFRVTGTILPKRYSSDHPGSAYVEHAPDKFGKYGQFVAEILKKVDEDVDLGRFDNDGPDGLINSGDDDGNVDYIFINTLSTPQDFILGGATGIANLGPVVYESSDRNTRGGRIMVVGSIRHGSLQQEGNFAQTVGSMAHEFGHRLGLPDLYDLAYNTPEEDSAGIGRWGLMGWGAHGWNGQDGPAPFSAWSLEQLGWIGFDNHRLVEVKTDSSEIEIVDVLNGGSIYKIPLRNTSGRKHGFAQEYLLAEQLTRSSSFYRRNIPAEGLLLWHVKPQRGDNGDEISKVVDLICADGLYTDKGFPAGLLPNDRHGRDNLDFWAHDDHYARSKGGNFGDATDPFDGVHRTQFGHHSNPSNNPQSLSSPAMTGVNLSMRRQDNNMVMDVTLPRWAGVIDNRIHWSGNVVIDGDVRVTDSGELHIHPDTKVRFAGNDRLRSGIDPALNELEINGDLIVGFNFGTDSFRFDTDIVFKALHPGDTWYGIVIDPADSSRIEVAPSNMVLEDDQHGFVFQGAPSSLQEPKLDLTIDFVDDPDRTVAGNGDGTFNPGETVLIELTLDNWTLGTYRNVKPILRWNSPLVSPAWDREFFQQRSNRLTLEDSFDLYPATSHTDIVPLTLSREANPGAQIRLVVDYGNRVYVGSRSTSKREQMLRDTLNLVVTGEYTENDVKFEVPGTEIYGRSLLAPVTADTPVRALIKGDITGADLLVRTLQGRDLAMILPMTPHGTRGDRQLFEVSIPKRLEGFFETFVRVHGKNGYTTLADSTLLLGMTPISNKTKLLSFVDNEISKEHPRLMEIIDSTATALNLSHYAVNSAPNDEKLYELLLPALAGRRMTIVWIGKHLDDGAQAHIRSFLEDGGRILISSRHFKTNRMSPRFPTEILHIHSSKQKGTHFLRGLDLSWPTPFKSIYSVLSLIPPAEPMLYDRHSNAAASRVDNGTFRLVYYPFELSSLKEDVARSLVEAGLTYLNMKNTSPAFMELDQDQTVGQSVLLQGGEASLARVRVIPDVDRVEIQVRTLPTMALLTVHGRRGIDSFPLARNATEPQIFEGTIDIDQPGSYLLSTQIVDRRGAMLPNNARSRVLRLLDRPNLVIVNDEFDKANRAQSLKKIEQAFAANGTTANIIAHLDTDKSAYESLILDYANPDQALYWLGEFGEREVPPMLERYLERGGRLFLSARGTGLFNMEEFAEKYLFSTIGHYEKKPIGHVLASYVGVPIDHKKKVKHRVLDSSPPAAPLIISNQGEIAGIHVTHEAYRAIYYAFDLINLLNFEEILSHVIPLLQRNLSQEAELTLPGNNVLDDTAVLLKGIEAPIELTTSTDVASAELVVYGSRLAHSLGLPLDRSSQMNRTEHVFATRWTPEVTGSFRLVSRLQKADGREVLGSRSLHVGSVNFKEWNQVLIVDKLMNGAATVKDVISILESRGLKANLLDRRAELNDPIFYDALMDHYRGEGRFVIWLSSMVSEQEQGIIRNHALRGGNILVATLSVAHPPTGGQFKQEILGIGTEIYRAGLGKFETFEGRGQNGRIPFVSVVPMNGTEPVLVDINGRVGAVRRDAGVFRSAFIGLDLPKMTVESRRGLLEEQIAFLDDSRAIVLEPRLHIQSELAPGEARPAGTLTPELTVVNSGNGVSEPFSVEYRVLSQNHVVTSQLIQQPPLAPFSERRIAFPTSPSLESGSYQLEFGLSSSLGTSAVFLEPLALNLVSVPVRFAAMDLGDNLAYSNGAGFFDADDDGDLDFLLTRQGYEDQFFRNDGHEFHSFGEEVGLADSGLGRGFGVGDFDGDGDLDLYLVRQGQTNRLLRNQHSVFTDVTDQFVAANGATLGDDGAGRSAAFWDADSDGDLDLFLVNAAPDRNRLFRNNGNWFVDSSSAVGLDDEGDGRGLSFGDFDRDGDADILLANRSGPSRLYRNNTGYFEDVSEDFGIQFSHDDVAGIFGDYDGDGFVDLFTTGETSGNRLFQNVAGTAFSWIQSASIGESCGGAAFVDVDNDGDLDIVTTGVNLNSGGDQLFENHNSEWRPMGSFAGLATESAGRGLSVADFDTDGDQDLLVADVVGSRLYRNDLESSRWLNLNLAGIGGNPDGVGASIELVTSQGRQYAELQTGYGYGSQGPPEIHFGLGGETRIDTLRVRWPDGRESVRTDLQGNRQLSVAYPQSPLSLTASGQALPDVLTLYPSYPNPFNATSSIPYYLPEAGSVELTIYNVAGQRVRRLVAKSKTTGFLSFVWDGTDDSGHEVATGIYTYQLSTERQTQIGRVMLVK